MQSGEECGAARPHVVAIPYPLMGHITPVVQICKILIAKAGCRVTIACNTRLVPSLRRLIPQSLRHVDVLPISDGLRDPASPGLNYDRTRENLLQGFHHGMRRSFVELVEAGGFSDAVCVISDMYLSWTQDVADQLGIPRIAVWAASAAEFQVYFHAKQLIKEGKLPFQVPKGKKADSFDEMVPQALGKPPMYHRVDGLHCGENEEIEIPSLAILKRSDFPTFLQIEDASDPLFYTFIEHIKTCHHASMVLFNSFEALDGSFFTTMRSHGVNAQPMGPLFLLEDHWISPQVPRTQDHAKMEASGVQDEEGYKECLKWLDGQRPKSVIYVAFGTLIRLAKDQVRELAFGLLNSSHSFIWVYPPSKDGNKRELPENFLNQVKDKGLILDWVPQKRILNHPSIGAFLSHCGWNSTLESICSGVPMLCLPYITDQYLHRKMIVDKWNVGLRLERSYVDGIVSANEISQLIEEILVGTKGDQLKKRAQELKLATHSSIEPGGPSLLTLDNIIKLIRAVKEMS